MASFHVPNREKRRGRHDEMQDLPEFLARPLTTPGDHQCISLESCGIRQPVDIQRHLMKNAVVGSATWLLERGRGGNMVRDRVNGTWLSESKEYRLVVEKSSNVDSTFEGRYYAEVLGHGTLEYGVTGRWYYVHEATQTKVVFGFTACSRPPDRPYCVMDAWTGVLYPPEGPDANLLTMVGVRTELNEKGEHFDTELRAHVFNPVK